MTPEQRSRGATETSSSGERSINIEGEGVTVFGIARRGPATPSTEHLCSGKFRNHETTTKRRESHEISRETPQVHETTDVMMKREKKRPFFTRLPPISLYIILLLEYNVVVVRRKEAMTKATITKKRLNEVRQDLELSSLADLANLAGGRGKIRFNYYMTQITREDLIEMCLERIKKDPSIYEV